MHIYSEIQLKQIISWKLDSNSKNSKKKKSNWIMSKWIIIDLRFVQTWWIMHCRCYCLKFCKEIGVAWLLLFQEIKKCHTSQAFRVTYAGMKFLHSHAATAPNTWGLEASTPLEVILWGLSPHRITSRELITYSIT